MAWYVSEPDVDNTLAGPFLTSEEATEEADYLEAEGTLTEVYYLAGDGDTEDALRRALALGQGADMDAHDTDHRR